MSFSEYVYNGWPYAIVIALRDIVQGEELLVNYGENYWDGTVEVDREIITEFENEQSKLANETVGLLPYNPISI